APDAPLAIRESGSAALTPIPVDGGDPLLAQCSHFVSCVRRGDTTGGNGAHALDVVRVLEAGAGTMAAGGTAVQGARAGGRGALRARCARGRIRPRLSIGARVSARGRRSGTSATSWRGRGSGRGACWDRTCSWRAGR